MKHALTTALLLTSTTATAQETAQDYQPKQPYHFMAVGGVDTGLNGPATPTPVVRLGWYDTIDNTRLDYLLQADALTALAEIERRDTIGVGIGAVLNHTSWCDYRHYEHGERDKEKEVTCQEVGAAPFTSLSLGAVRGRVSSLIAQKWYAQGEWSNDHESPNSHIIVRSRADFNLGQLAIDDKVFSVREGITIRIMGEHEARPGYKSNDTNVSNQTNTYGFFSHLQAGFGSSLNITLDIRAGTQKNADRHNAWKLGGFVSPFLPFPGLSYAEIHAETFGEARIGVSHALHQSVRFGAAGYLLGLTRDNVEGYTGNTEPVRVGLDLSLRARFGENIPPMGVNVGWTPDTGRDQSGDALSVIAYLAIALGKIDSQKIEKESQ